MKKSILLIIALMFVASGCGGIKLSEKDFPIIPRTVFTDNPEKASPMICADGTKLAWSAPYKGVMNIWVAPVGKLEEAKPVTKSRDGPINNFYWGLKGDRIVYLKDEGGNEWYHVYLVDLAGGNVKDLTPGNGFRAFFYSFNHENPDEIAIMTNQRNPQFMDILKTNVVTGKTEMIYAGDDGMQVYLDSGLNIKTGVSYNAEGESEIYLYKKGKWELKETIPFEDQMNSSLSAIDRSGRFQYMDSSVGRDTSALFKINLETWEKTLVVEDEKSDSVDWIAENSTGNYVAVGFNYERKYWKVIDDRFQKDIDYLTNFQDGDFFVTDTSPDDRFWLVSYMNDNRPTTYFLYNRETGKAEYLYSNRPDLEKLKLAKMKPQVIKSRDGLDLVCFITLPPWTDPDNNGIPDNPVPLILNIHGGPYVRDSWGLDPTHQYFANRGYAVASVNYRGSWGFGKNFLNRGNGEWGGKIQDDITDVADWAIARKIAIPEKIAILGRSFGGYCVLSALTTNPEKFACGVDVVGISNLVTYMKSVPGYFKRMYDSYKKQIGGDPDTPEGRRYLESKSPINYVDKIVKPLLIGHGANDSRVSVSESETIVKAMQARKLPVTLCLFPDEGHQFQKPENKRAFYAIAESFFNKHLGGRVESMIAEDFEKSSLEIKAGVGLFDGLEQLLPNKTEKPAEKKEK